MLTLIPPETRGISAAVCSVLIALAWLAQRPGDPVLRDLNRVVWLTFGRVLPRIVWSASPAAAIAPVSFFLLAGAIGIAAARAAARPGFGELISRLLAGVASLLSLYGIYQSLYGLDRLAARIAADPTLADQHDLALRAATGRALATFSTPAALGIFLAMSIPVTVALVVSSRSRVRWGWGGAVLVQLAALVSSASATAVAALLVALMLSAMVWSRTRRWALLAAVVAMLVFGGVIAMRGGQILSTTDKNSSLRLRAGNFRSATAMAVDHPWLGAGLGSFSENYSKYRQAGDNEIRHVHDLPLELTAETGVVVGPLLAALFFIVFLSPLIRIREHDPAWKRAIALGLAAFAIHNLADYTAYMPSLLWLAALLRGLLAASAPAGDPAQETSHFRWGEFAASGAMVTMILVAASILALTGLSEDQRFAARIAAFAGETESAEALAARAVRWAPWSADATLLHARATLGGDGTGPSSPERSAHALQLANRAVDLAPTRAAARAQRARARMAHRDVSGAYADLVEAVRLYPLHDGYRADRDHLAVQMRQRQEPELVP